MKIPFNKPFIVGKELFYIAQAVMEFSRLSGDGPFTKFCQDWLENRLSCNKVLLTHSCTAALEMAAILCGIQPGDEVIMPSFTFVSTANAFVLRGAIPVFVDIREDTLNIDETLIEHAISSKTRAIVPVHYAGKACAMNDIVDIAQRHDIWVIEDAAQALLSTYEGRSLGTIGHIGCLSFHETKNVISGEGGALILNDDRLINRAEIIWEKGTNRKKFHRGEIDKYTWVDIGSSYLPSELVSAFLFAQLEHADEIICRRRRIFAYYRMSLQDLTASGKVRIPAEDGKDISNGHLFYLVTRCEDERSRLIRFLENEGINALFHYVPLHSSPAGISFARTGSPMNITDNMSSRIVRLPLYYDMNEYEVDIVVDAVKKFYCQTITLNDKVSLL